MFRIVKGWKRVTLFEVANECLSPYGGRVLVTKLPTIADCDWIGRIDPCIAMTATSDLSSSSTYRLFAMTFNGFGNIRISSQGVFMLGCMRAWVNKLSWA